MPEWTRHLVFALVMAALVVTGALALGQWTTTPAASSVLDSPVASILLMVFAGVV